MGARRGSPFMAELLSAISEAVALSGYSVEQVWDAFPPPPPPPDADCVYVVIPHEFWAWGDPAGLPTPAQRGQTIALCTENPGTSWFEQTAALVPHFGGAIAINRASAASLRSRGIACEHLQLGYAPEWDLWRRDQQRARPVDVLYLGTADPRREQLLSAYGELLSRRRCRLLIPPLEQRQLARVDFVIGEEKRRLLGSARILINLHRGESHNLEWLRYLEAASNGCVVVSEPSCDHEPLVPGRHLVVAEADAIPSEVTSLLDDDERLAQMRYQAYDFVRNELPLVAGTQRLTQLAADLPRAVGTEAPAAYPRSPPSLSPPRAEWMPRHGAAAACPARRLAIRPDVQSRAFAASRPKTSVILAGEHREAHLRRWLESFRALRSDDFELLVVSRARAAVAAFADEHPGLPTALIHSGPDPDPAGPRNLLCRQARGENLLVLPPGSALYPAALQRLSEALDGDTSAAFAYPMVAAIDDGNPVGLLSSLPWEPRRLRRGNYIGAVALIRGEYLARVGGYTEDTRMAGVEDFHLWCQFADAGYHGVLVPQVLAACPVSPRVDADPSIVAAMEARFPELRAQDRR